MQQEASGSSLTQAERGVWARSPPWAQHLLRSALALTLGFHVAPALPSGLWLSAGLCPGRKSGLGSVRLPSPS